jgi:hypothetical protein
MGVYRTCFVYKRKTGAEDGGERRRLCGYGGAFGFCKGGRSMGAGAQAATLRCTTSPRSLSMSRPKSYHYT